MSVKRFYTFRRCFFRHISTEKHHKMSQKHTFAFTHHWTGRMGSHDQFTSNSLCSYADSQHQERRCSPQQMAAERYYIIFLKHPKLVRQDFTSITTYVFTIPYHITLFNRNACKSQLYCVQMLKISLLLYDKMQWRAR